MVAHSRATLAAASSSQSSQAARSVRSTGYWLSKDNLYNSLLQVLNSKEWTIPAIDYAMSHLEADPSPKHAKKLERAQALANELLRIDGWDTLRSKMVAVDAKYPNSGGGMSQHVTNILGYVPH